METPNSSMRRVRISRTAAASNNKNMPISSEGGDLEQDLSKSREEKNGKRRDLQQEESNKHSALVDITNNSPIVGLATRRLPTPSSYFSKDRSSRGEAMATPGS
ncbi:hypothetical protein SAY86_031553 [Trapa natans]|uniref:Uncharacterized protein n=1 Tax=Trapa natans TaxID=22666 RepID=A0AAN7M7S8_TRANT|nr:hypothetical protein SAY86_031553 [Trapa natans]